MTQLTEDEMRNLVALIKHGFKSLISQGEERVFLLPLDQDDSVATEGTLPAVRFEYSDNNRFLYKLYEKFGEDALLSMLKEVVVKCANKRFPDMRFTADRGMLDFEDPAATYDYMGEWGVHSMWFPSRAKGNSRGQPSEHSCQPDSCCLWWECLIDKVTDPAQPLKIYLTFANPGFTDYRLNAPDGYV